MRIEGRNAVRMIDDHGGAVSAPPSGEANRSCAGGVYCLTPLRVDIHALVRPPSASGGSRPVSEAAHDPIAPPALDGRAQGYGDRPSRIACRRPRGRCAALRHCAAPGAILRRARAREGARESRRQRGGRSEAHTGRRDKGVPSIGALRKVPCVHRACLSRITEEDKWSGRVELNHRPPGPEPGALTGLRYAPTCRVLR